MIDDPEDRHRCGNLLTQGLGAIAQVGNRLAGGKPGDECVGGRIRERSQGGPAAREDPHVEAVVAQVFREGRGVRLGRSDQEDHRARGRCSRCDWGETGEGGIGGRPGRLPGALAQLGGHFLDPGLAQRHHDAGDGFHLIAR